jgi:hypothetical protein
MARTLRQFWESTTSLVDRLTSPIASALSGTFAALSHQHSGGDITSGTVANARTTGTANATVNTLFLRNASAGGSVGAGGLVSSGGITVSGTSALSSVTATTFSGTNLISYAVAGGSGSLLGAFKTSAAERVQFYDEGSGLGPRVFFNAGARARIDGSGDISIVRALNVGTDAAPTNALTVNGGLRAYGSFSDVTTNVGAYLGIVSTTPRLMFANGTAAQNWTVDNNSGQFRFYLPGVTYMTLTTTEAQFALGIAIAGGNSSATGTGGIRLSGSSFTSSGWNLRIADNGTTGDLYFDREFGGWQSGAMRLERATGNVGLGATPTAKLDINSDVLRLRTAKTPASAGATGNAGDICWDASYLYVCTATNTWRRIAHATW